MEGNIELGDMKNAALLVMDYQKMLVQAYVPDPADMLANAADAISKAHSNGIKVIYIQKSFREGYPEVHDNNKIFAGVRQGGRLLQSDENTQIASEIAPASTDIVVQAHRIGAFEGTELELILRSQKIDTLILFGITTSGVVLSTVRQAADKDFNIIVLRDLCADGDREVGEFLLNKILPSQAVLKNSADLFSA